MRKVTMGKSSGKTCLICDDEAYHHHRQHERETNWQEMSWGLPPPPPGDGGGGDDLGAKVNSQLPVILLVRKILRMPSQVMERLLLERGNPSDWGIQLCGPCRRVFREAEFVHSRISELNREFEGLATKLREQLKESDRKKFSNGNGGGGTTSTSGRRSRSRRRVKEPECEMDAGKESVLCLRQEFLKRTRERNHENPIDKLEILENRERVDVEGIPECSSPTISAYHDDFSRIGKVEFEPNNDLDMPQLDDLMDRDCEDSLQSFMDEVSVTGSELNDDRMPNLEAQGGGNDPDYSPSPSGGKISGKCDTIDSARSRRKMKIKIKVFPDGESQRLTSKRINPFAIEQPVKAEKDYKCPLCIRTAALKSSMHGHILRAHYGDSKPFHCHLCRKDFRRDTRLRDHLSLHHNGAKTLYDADDATFGSVDVIEEVIPKKRAGTGQHFTCDLCPSTLKYKGSFRSEEGLEAHKKLVHLGIKRPYECKLCGKSFKQRDRLRQHILVHSKFETVGKKLKELYCLNCNREFKNIQTLRDHLNSTNCKLYMQIPEEPTLQDKIEEKDEEEEEEKKKPEQEDVIRPVCLECNREFKTHSSLQNHLKTSKSHAPGAMYQCELCAKGFFQKRSLENHQAYIHHAELNIQPFKCTFCGKMVSSQRHLDHHIAIKHIKKTLFKCIDCNMGFMTRCNYAQHVSAVHKRDKPFQCSGCPKRFSNKTLLTVHMRTHTGEKPFKCKDCGKEYADQPTFKRHLETHGETVHKCTICAKQFKVWHSYRLHMKKHNQYLYKNPNPNNEATAESESLGIPLSPTSLAVENDAELPNTEQPDPEMKLPIMEAGSSLNNLAEETEAPMEV